MCCEEYKHSNISNINVILKEAGYSLHEPNEKYTREMNELIEENLIEDMEFENEDEEDYYLQEMSEYIDEILDINKPSPTKRQNNNKSTVKK